MGTFTYQWIREGILISSETDSSYFLTDADVGNSISVKVSYTDAKGTSESVMSYETVEIEDVVTEQLEPFLLLIAEQALRQSWTSTLIAQKTREMQVLVLWMLLSSLILLKQVLRLSAMQMDLSDQ